MGTKDDHILIVGTGFGGLGLAVRLKKAGIEDFTILEQADDVGGTWRDNHYPGATCDVQSHMYSFSFEPNPDWSHHFARQPAILDYLRHCTDKYDLRRHIRFNTEVRRAEFDVKSSMWTLETNRGDFVARVFVPATGGLTKAWYPEIPGRDRFRGESFHTARWDDDASLAGKRVGVIGTGASAIQVVPSIVDQVGHLEVFQRTAPWVLPKPDGPIPSSRRALYRHVPLAQKLERLRLYLQLEVRAVGFIKQPRLMKWVEAQVEKHVDKTVSDPALRQKLIPNYRAGCKRILMSNEYYPALTRPNCDLVTSRIEEICPEGIRTDDGKLHELDAIVYATGFKAAEAGAPFPITGRDGRDLETQWEGGAEAYKGAAIPGFPNAFMVAGPNIGLGHNSVVYMLECVADYTLEAIKTMRRRNIEQLEVDSRVHDRYNAELQRRSVGTVWKSGCQSYYLTREGKNVALWPGFSFEFRRRTRTFDAENYHVVESDPARRAPPRAPADTPTTPPAPTQAPPAAAAAGYERS